MNVCQFWHYGVLRLNWTLLIENIRKEMLRIYYEVSSIQEKLNTILRNNEGKNENTNEYVWKLITYINFSSTC